MEKIEVTEEMQSRTMEKIRKADVSAAHRALPFQKLRRYAALAAALVGVFALPALFRQRGALRPAPPQKSSQKQLGFSVTDITALPFVPERADYYAY